MPSSLQSTLERAARIAAQASSLVSARVGAERITYKGKIDLVTATDRASEELIAALLREQFPGDRLQLEEGGAQGEGEGPRWIVDPLDGTTNFAHELPQTAITLAREVDGRIEIGVIADVWRQEIYGAARGQGAWVQDRQGQRQPLKVSQTRTLERGLLATGFPYDRHTERDNNLREFAAFLTKAQGIRRLGAAALDLAWVARGRLDAYWEMKLGAWDIAAGALLVSEAGGRVSDYRGQPCDRWGPETVASNGLLHEAMLEVLGPLRAASEGGTEAAAE